MLDVEEAIKSTEYQAFIKAVCELQKVDISALKPSKIVAFFLNIYQCMYVHQFFKLVTENRQSETESVGVISALSSMMGRNKDKQFFYNIAGIDFTIADIKHGMLRGN